MQDGLVANPVRRIFQDSKGFIWIGTWEGLSKYDGYRFTNFTIANGLSHNVVNDFFEDNGKLYVALNNGTIDMIQNDRIQKIISTPSGLNHFLQLQNGIVLVNSDHDGFYEYRNGTFSKPPHQEPGLGCNEIIELNDSLLLASTYDTLNFFSKDYRHISTIITNKIENISYYRDSKKRILAGTALGIKLLSPLLPKNGSSVFSPAPTQFNIPVVNNYITSIYEETNETFWIGTTNGLIRIASNGHYDVYTESDGLPSNVIRTIFEDVENNIWIGTEAGIAKMVQQYGILVLNKNNGVPRPYVTSVFPWKHNLILTTDSGLQLYNIKTNRFIETQKDEKKTYITFVKGSSPLLYSNYNSLGIFDSMSARVIPVRSFGHPILGREPCSDTSNTVFFGVNNGIEVLTRKKAWLDKIIPFFITQLLIDNKRYLWAGTWENGLYRIQYSLLNDSLIFSKTAFSDLITDKHIRSLFCDSKGNIWVGTRYSGAFCLTPKNDNHQYEAKQFDQRNGLMSNFIKTFAEDENGNIWIGTRLGIDKLIKEKNNFRVFNFSLVTNFFGSIKSITKDKNNNWWLLTEDCILAKCVDRHLENFLPMQAHFTSILLGSPEKKLTVSDKDSVIKLKHIENQAQFAFSAPTYINEKQIFYSYRLLGADDTNWSKPKNTHEVSYASLQPGNYRFEVRVLGWNGEFGKSAFFSFIIKPPFWRTWWFMGICILAFGSLVYILFRFRINQILKVQKVRNRLAADLHDEIGSTLTNINILSEISRKNIRQPMEAEKFLQKISDEVTSSSQALDDIIWSINTTNDSLNETLTRMRRYGAELFENTDMKCHFDFATPMNGTLQMEKRKDVYLIYKEMLNNILKHSEATEMWTSVRLNNKHLSFTVRDNGKGFDPGKPTNRNGLKYMKSRVNQWKGEMKIESGENGTTIYINIPIENKKTPPHPFGG